MIKMHKVFLVILGRALRFYIYDSKYLLEFAFVLLLYVCSFIFLIDSHQISSMAISIMLACWLQALLSNTQSSLERDFHLGFLQQFYLTGTSTEIIILAYYIAQLLWSGCIILLFIPIIFVILSLPLHTWAANAVVMLLLAAIIMILRLLTAAMFLGQLPNIIRHIVALPIAAPAIILAGMSLRISYSYIGLLAALWIFITPLIIYAASCAVISAFDD